jgi:hypothetical protein
MPSLETILTGLDLMGFDGAGGTDKGTDHSYLPVYERLLSPRRLDPIHLCEIGIYHGPWRIDAPYTMGMHGCDNAIAHELVKRRYMVTNPCMTVKAIHLHRSGYRTYRTGPGRPKQYVVPPPYTLVLPCAL